MPVRDAGLRGQKFKDPFARCTGLGELIVEAREILDWRVHQKNAQDNLDKITGAGTGLGEIDQIQQRQRHAQGSQKINDRPRNFVGADDAHILADRLVRRVAKLGSDDVFEIVGLDNAMTGEGLGHDLHQAGGLRLHLAAGPANFAVVNGQGNQAKRQDNQREQGQFSRLRPVQQQGQHADQRDRVTDDDRGGAAQNALQRGGVAHDARDEFAAAVFGEKTSGKIQQMRKEAHANVGNGADGRPLQKIDVQVGKQAP